jgi:hypothetical protein
LFKESGEEVDANLLKAVEAAIKLDKDPLPPGLRQDASLEELEAEMKKHWERLAPVLDLEALVASSGGIGNRDMAEANRATTLGSHMTKRPSMRATTTAGRRD